MAPADLVWQGLKFLALDYPLKGILCPEIIEEPGVFPCCHAVA